MGKSDKDKPAIGVVRPNQGDLVEKVRKSMCENLNRDVTEQEARQHIKIFYSWQNAAHSRGNFDFTEKKKTARMFSLDEIAGDEGTIGNLRNWSIWWNDVKDGTIMASTPDFYNGFKELKHAYILEDIEKARKADEIIKSIRADLRDASIITGTRADYDITRKKRSNAKSKITLTHHYNCQYKSAIKRLRVGVPLCGVAPTIISVGKDIGGLEFLQTLCYTSDSPNMMAKIIGFVADVEVENIKLVMEKEEKDIREYPHRVVRFVRHNNSLYIILAKLESQGCSRGYNAPYYTS